MNSNKTNAHTRQIKFKHRKVQKNKPELLDLLFRMLLLKLREPILVPLSKRQEGAVGGGCDFIAEPARGMGRASRRPLGPPPYCTCYDTTAIVRIRRSFEQAISIAVTCNKATKHPASRRKTFGDIQISSQNSHSQMTSLRLLCLPVSIERLSGFCLFAIARRCVLIHFTVVRSLHILHTLLCGCN